VSWTRRLAVGAAATAGLGAVSCAGLAGYGALQDPEIELQVEQTLPAGLRAVHDHLDDVDGLQAWWGEAMERYAAEHGEGTAMEVRHVEGSPQRGQGTRIEFVAGGMTAETWEILELRRDRVVYDVDFQMFRVRRTLELHATGPDQTTVRWVEAGTISNPFVRALAALSGGDEGAKANFRDALQALGAVASESPSGGASR